ncbi:MAG: hypothetical protein ACPHUL_00220 [Marinomonas gallaica]
MSKLTTQIIDKIEDVRFNDVIEWEGDKYVASGDSCNGVDIKVDMGDWLPFNECAVVRLTLEEE